MNQETLPAVYGYGNNFESVGDLEKAIQQRKEKGTEDLSGAAICWIKRDDINNPLGELEIIVGYRGKLILPEDF